LNPVEREPAPRFESLLRDEKGEATFAEPWQAQAFALVVHLHSKGAFTWQEWASALSDEIKRATARGEQDDGTHYFDHWLAALEQLVRQRGLAEGSALAARKDAWAEAYRRTPHGKPVEL
jgi:nitrile hydratase accessory protein